MLQRFEACAGAADWTVEQPWTFTVKEGDVRCMAHTINLAVQSALRTLKATPDENFNAYRSEEHAARISSEEARFAPVTNSLEKMRRHIYAYRDRRLWRDALQKQARTTGLPYRRLKLDMPVRWGSTFTMLKRALDLQVPITAHCATQSLDLSMRSIRLHDDDWATLHTLRDMFEIFDRPTTTLQGDTYYTLNRTLPAYLWMMTKLDVMRKKVGHQSTIGEACTAVWDKLNDYYTMATTQKQSHSAIATICDPRLTLRCFDQLFPLSGQSDQRGRARTAFHIVYDAYKRHADEIEVELPSHNANLLSQNAVAIDSDNDLYTTSRQTTEPEWRRWIAEPGIGRHEDILQYWKVRQHEYPILSRVARDYLAISATSKASERVFGAGGNIITKNRNRLSVSTVRYLLCLRSWRVLPPPEINEEEAQPAESD